MSDKPDFTWRGHAGTVRKITYVEGHSPLFVASVLVGGKHFEGQSNYRDRAIAQCRRRLDRVMRSMLLAWEHTPGNWVS